MRSPAPGFSGAVLERQCLPMPPRVFIHLRTVEPGGGLPYSATTSGVNIWTRCRLIAPLDQAGPLVQLDEDELDPARLVQASTPRARRVVLRPRAITDDRDLASRDDETALAPFGQEPELRRRGAVVEDEGPVRTNARHRQGAIVHSAQAQHETFVVRDGRPVEARKSELQAACSRAGVAVGAARTATVASEIISPSGSCRTPRHMRPRTMSTAPGHSAEDVPDLADGHPVPVRPHGAFDEEGLHVLVDRGRTTASGSGRRCRGSASSAPCPHRSRLRSASPDPRHVLHGIDLGAIVGIRHLPAGVLALSLDDEDVAVPSEGATMSGK